MPDTAMPILRFGIIADPQYADIEPNPALDRHYRQSLQKLGEAISVFNAEPLDFVVTLGDIIDRDWRSFNDVMPLYRTLRHRQVFLLGNHDFAVDAQHLDEVADRLGMPGRYYDFALGGWRFIVLDGSDVSIFSTVADDPRNRLAVERLAALQAAGAINAQTWNGSLGDDQLSWLTDVLRRADADGEAVLVFCHYPVFPPNAHNLWDSERVMDTLTGFDCFKAYFCGHNHAGNSGIVAGRPFITFRGMVDTQTENTFAIAEIHPDRIDIRGFGREESRSLPL